MTATVTVTAAELRRAAGCYGWAKPPGKPVIPILRNVRVSITGGQLVVAWFDWETLLLARIPGQPATPGQAASVLVPVDQLEAAITTAAGADTKVTQVEVTVHGGDKVDLVRGAGTTNAHRVSVGQTGDPAAYPKFPAMPALTGVTDAGAFTRAVTQVAGCCSTDDTLPVVTAVHFVPGPDGLELQGTERHILAIDQIPFRPAKAAETPGFLVPAGQAARFAKGCEGPVFIGAPNAEGFALLSDMWHTMVVKTITGEYPKVRTVVDRAPEPVATFTTDAAKLRAVLGEARGLLDAAVEEMIDEAVAASETEELTDRARKQKTTDIRRNLRHDHAGMGMFITAGPGTVEVVAAHRGTGVELGRWQVAAPGETGEVTVCLNPALLTLLLPASGDVTVALSAPGKNVRVTVPGSAYEGVACPIKADPPAREEVTI